MLDAGGGYHLIVASAPLSLYGAEAIDALLGELEWVAERGAEHEAVVEYAMGIGTVVPMKLFTLFTDDERALRHVRRMKRSLDRVVARIAGCEEWGLRILFDPIRAERAARAAADEDEGTTRPGTSNETVSGTSFLHRKKAHESERRRAGARGAAAVGELYDRLVTITREAQRRGGPSREPGASIVLDAVFLVPRESVKQLKAIVADSATALVPKGFNVVLTGPWPAYSFVGGGARGPRTSSSA
jgi:hypothetical protein